MAHAASMSTPELQADQPVVVAEAAGMPHKSPLGFRGGPEQAIALDGAALAVGG